MAVPNYIPIILKVYLPFKVGHSQNWPVSLHRSLSFILKTFRLNLMEVFSRRERKHTTQTLKSSPPPALPGHRRTLISSSQHAQDNKHPCASVCVPAGWEGWASLPSHVAVCAPRRNPSVFQTHQRRPGERDTRDTRGAQCSRCSAQASYQSCGNAMLRAKSTWPRTSANIWGVPDSAGATGAAS